MKRERREEIKRKAILFFILFIFFNSNFGQAVVAQINLGLSSGLQRKFSNEQDMMSYLAKLSPKDKLEFINSSTTVCSLTGEKIFSSEDKSTYKFLCFVNNVQDINLQLTLKILNVGKNGFDFLGFTSSNDDAIRFDGYGSLKFTIFNQSRVVFSYLISSKNVPGIDADTNQGKIIILDTPDEFTKFLNTLHDTESLLFLKNAYEQIFGSEPALSYSTQNISTSDSSAQAILSSLTSDEIVSIATQGSISKSSDSITYTLTLDTNTGKIVAKLGNQEVGTADVGMSFINVPQALNETQNLYMQSILGQSGQTFNATQSVTGQAAKITGQNVLTDFWDWLQSIVGGKKPQVENVVVGTNDKIFLQTAGSSSSSSSPIKVIFYPLESGSVENGVLINPKYSSTPTIKQVSSLEEGITSFANLMEDNFKAEGIQTVEGWALILKSNDQIVIFDVSKHMQRQVSKGSTISEGELKVLTDEIKSYGLQDAVFLGDIHNDPIVAKAEFSSGDIAGSISWRNMVDSEKISIVYSNQDGSSKILKISRSEIDAAYQNFIETGSIDTGGIGKEITMSDAENFVRIKSGTQNPGVTGTENPSLSAARNMDNRKNMEDIAANQKVGFTRPTLAEIEAYALQRYAEMNNLDPSSRATIADFNTFKSTAEGDIFMQDIMIERWGTVSGGAPVESEAAKISAENNILVSPIDGKATVAWDVNTIKAKGSATLDIFIKNGESGDYDYFTAIKLELKNDPATNKVSFRLLGRDLGTVDIGPTNGYAQLDIKTERWMYGEGGIDRSSIKYSNKAPMVEVARIEPQAAQTTGTASQGVAVERAVKLSDLLDIANGKIDAYQLDVTIIGFKRSGQILTPVDVVADIQSKLGIKFGSSSGGYRFEVADGWAWIIPESGLPHEDLGRFYLPLNPEGAADTFKFFADASKDFKTMEFKLPDNYAKFGRQDAAVLYFTQEEQGKALDLIRAYNEKFGNAYLRPDTPFFTAKVLDANGKSMNIGFGEEPTPEALARLGNLGSFNGWRSKILADIAPQLKGKTPAEVEAIIKQAFSAEGIDPDNFAFNKGSQGWDIIKSNTAKETLSVELERPVFVTRNDLTNLGLSNQAADTIIARGTTASQAETTAESVSLLSRVQQWIGERDSIRIPSFVSTLKDWATSVRETVGRTFSVSGTDAAPQIATGSDTFAVTRDASGGATLNALNAVRSFFVDRLGNTFVFDSTDIKGFMNDPTAKDLEILTKNGKELDVFSNQNGEIRYTIDDPLTGEALSHQVKYYNRNDAAQMQDFYDTAKNLAVGSFLDKIIDFTKISKAGDVFPFQIKVGDNVENQRFRHTEIDDMVREVQNADGTWTSVSSENLNSEWAIDEPNGISNMKADTQSWLAKVDIDSILVPNQIKVTPFEMQGMSYDLNDFFKNSKSGQELAITIHDEKLGDITHTFTNDGNSFTHKIYYQRTGQYDTKVEQFDVTKPLEVQAAQATALEIIKQRLLDDIDTAVQKIEPGNRIVITIEGPEGPEQIGIKVTETGYLDYQKPGPTDWETVKEFGQTTNENSRFALEKQIGTDILDRPGTYGISTEDIKGNTLGVTEAGRTIPVPDKFPDIVGVITDVYIIGSTIYQVGQLQQQGVFGKLLAVQGGPQGFYTTTEITPSQKAQLSMLPVNALFVAQATPSIFKFLNYAWKTKSLIQAGEAAVEATTATSLLVSGGTLAAFYVVQEVGIHTATAFYDQGQLQGIGISSSRDAGQQTLTDYADFFAGVSQRGQYNPVWQAKYNEAYKAAATKAGSKAGDMSQSLDAYATWVANDYLYDAPVKTMTLPATHGQQGVIVLLSSRDVINQYVDVTGSDNIEQAIEAIMQQTGWSRDKATAALAGEKIGKAGYFENFVQSNSGKGNVNIFGINLEFSSHQHDALNAELLKESQNLKASIPQFTIKYGDNEITFENRNGKIIGTDKDGNEYIYTNGNTELTGIKDPFTGTFLQKDPTGAFVGTAADGTQISGTLTPGEEGTTFIGTYTSATTISHVTIYAGGDGLSTKTYTEIDDRATGQPIYFSAYDSGTGVTVYQDANHNPTGLTSTANQNGGQDYFSNGQWTQSTDASNNIVSFKDKQGIIWIKQKDGSELGYTGTDPDRKGDSIGSRQTINGHIITSYKDGTAVDQYSYSGGVLGEATIIIKISLNGVLVSEDAISKSGSTHTEYYSDGVTPSSVSTYNPTTNSGKTQYYDQKGNLVEYSIDIYGAKDASDQPLLTGRDLYNNNDQKIGHIDIVRDAAGVVTGTITKDANGNVIQSTENIPGGYNIFDAQHKQTGQVLNNPDGTTDSTMYDPGTKTVISQTKTFSNGVAVIKPTQSLPYVAVPNSFGLKITVKDSSQVTPNSDGSVTVQQLNYGIDPTTGKPGTARDANGNSGYYQNNRIVTTGTLKSNPATTISIVKESNPLSKYVATVYVNGAPIQVTQQALDDYWNKQIQSSTQSTNPTRTGYGGGAVNPNQGTSPQTGSQVAPTPAKCTPGGYGC